jgi:DNA repair exonuclease SbcCD ATPase subunit
MAVDDLIEDNLDRSKIRDEMKEWYRYDITDYPEGYFDTEDYELTDEQEERKEELENQINELQGQLENTEDENQVADLEEQIQNLQDELDSIVVNEEPTDEMIEKKVMEYVRGRDEVEWLKELDMDMKDYVNMKSVARDIVDHDGMGTLSSYDSDYHEVYITEPDGKRHNFVIIRTQ